MDRQIVLDYPDEPNSWDHTVLREDSQKCDGGSQSLTYSVRFDFPEGTMCPAVQKAIGKGKETDSPLGLWRGTEMCTTFVLAQGDIHRLCPLAFGSLESVEIHCNKELTYPTAVLWTLSAS